MVGDALVNDLGNDRERLAAFIEIAVASLPPSHSARSLLAPSLANRLCEARTAELCRLLRV